MAITITIQAASDAMMTDNNEPVRSSGGGTALADDDLRKVYGLPNQYVGYDGKIHFVNRPRWDFIDAPEPPIRKKYDFAAQDFEAEEDEGFFHFESSYNNDRANVRQGFHRPPTTTAFQLQCTNITHQATDMSNIAPMPGVDNAAGIKQDAGTPGQLNNLVIALGMRSEVIKLEGVLFDEGIISASNPRKQVLMNIARTQYFKTGRSGGNNRWGGAQGGPLNPRSYPCLTIFDSTLNVGSTSAYTITQPSNTNLSYRGLIKSLAFRQEGGRPNQWFWTMEFQVLQNEWPQGHQFMGKGLQEGVLRINRIRLIDVENGTEIANNAFPTEQGEAVIEIRTSDDLALPIRIGDTVSTVRQKQVEDPQTIFITNSNCTPKIDGDWILESVDFELNTFRLRNIGSHTVTATASHDYFDDDYSYGQPDVGQAWTGFTNGNDGYVMAGGGKTLSVVDGFTIQHLRELEASELRHGIGPNAEAFGIYE